jgi:hypothetical protein
MRIALARAAGFGLVAGASVMACGGGFQYDNGRARSDLLSSPQATASASEGPTLVRAVGGGPRDADPALSATVAKIAGARCEREMRCGRVGPNETFSSRESCVSKIQADKRGAADLNTCALGVNRDRLADCLNAIRDEDCGNALDVVTRLEACRSSNLCVR